MVKMGQVIFKNACRCFIGMLWMVWKVLLAKDWVVLVTRMLMDKTQPMRASTSITIRSWKCQKVSYHHARSVLLNCQNSNRWNTYGSARIERKCSDLHLKRAIWQRSTSPPKSPRSPRRCWSGQVFPRPIHRSLGLLQHGYVLPEAWPATRVCPMSWDLSRLNELQEVCLAQRQEYFVAHPQT